MESESFESLSFLLNNFYVKLFILVTVLLIWILWGFVGTENNNLTNITNKFPTKPVVLNSNEYASGIVNLKNKNSLIILTHGKNVGTDEIDFIFAQNCRSLERWCGRNRLKFEPGCTQCGL